MFLTTVFKSITSQYLAQIGFVSMQQSGQVKLWKVGSGRKSQGGIED